MGIFTILETSASALSAERQRAEIVAANLANAETTRTTGGGPYRRKEVVFSNSPSGSFRMLLAGSSAQPGALSDPVHVSQVVEDPAPPVMRYEPGNPDANSEGFVAYPNINPVMEMADLMDAVRAYQLNAAAVNASKQILVGALDILK